MFRSSFLSGLLVLIVAASFLFVMKHKVHNSNKKLSVINSQIISERENIHVLNAEIAYLSNPKRIKKLVHQHLHLQTPQRAQIVDADVLRKIVHEKELVALNASRKVDEE